MTEVKMPSAIESVKIFNHRTDCYEHMVAEDDYFTAAQMKQYGDDRAREALEMAAQLFEPAMTQEQAFDAVVIRALAEEIK